MVKPAQPMSDADFNKPDDELGRLLFDTWCAYQAEQHGVPLDAVSDEWIALIRAKSLEMDSDRADHAPLESALRKAARGDFAAAGKILRDYMLSGARAMVDEKYASIGIEQTRLRIQGGRASAEKRADDAKAWRAKCIEHAKLTPRHGVPSASNTPNCFWRQGPQPTNSRANARPNTAGLPARSGAC